MMLGPAGTPGAVPRSLSASAPSITFSTLVFHSTASLRGCLARPSPVPAEGTAQRCPWPCEAEPHTPATPHPCRFGFVPSFRCSQNSSFSFRKELLALLLLQPPAAGSTNRLSKRFLLLLAHACNPQGQPRREEAKKARCFPPTADG